MSILITSATSAPAYKLKNKLNYAEVFLGDYNEMPAFMVKSPGFLQLPNPASQSYQHDMLAICLDNNVDTVYVLNEGEFASLLESVQLFKEYNIEIVNGQVDI